MHTLNFRNFKLKEYSSSVKRRMQSQDNNDPWKNNDFHFSKKHNRWRISGSNFSFYPRSETRQCLSSQQQTTPSNKKKKKTADNSRGHRFNISTSVYRRLYKNWPDDGSSARARITSPKPRLICSSASILALTLDIYRLSGLSRLEKAESSDRKGFLIYLFFKNSSSSDTHTHKLFSGRW